MNLDSNPSNAADNAASAIAMASTPQAVIHNGTSAYEPHTNVEFICDALRDAVVSEHINPIRALRDTHRAAGQNLRYVLSDAAPGPGDTQLYLMSGKEGEPTGVHYRIDGALVTFTVNKKRTEAMRLGSSSTRNQVRATRFDLQ